MFFSYCPILVSSQAMLSVGLHWAGDYASRLGPSRVVNIARANIYFDRIRLQSVESIRFIWHPYLGKLFRTWHQEATLGEQHFRARQAVTE